MKKNIFLALVMSIVFNNAFSQIFMQFNQTPQYLNPALAGSAERTRLTMGTTLLENTGNYSYGRTHQAIYGVMAMDGYSKKLKSGWGVFYHSEQYRYTYNANISSYSEKLKINTNELAIQFAPKFTRAKKNNPGVPAITWSTGFEVRLGYTSVKHFGSALDLTDKGFSGGVRIGVSRNSAKSLFGFGYMLSYLSDDLTLKHRDVIYENEYINGRYRVYRNPSQVNSLFIHYGYSFYFDDAKDFGVTPMVSCSNRLNVNRGEKNSYFSFRHNGIILSGNFRFKKILAGTGYLLNNYINDGGLITFFSLGYQSKSLKVTGTYNIYTDYDRAAEVTMNYLF